MSTEQSAHAMLETLFDAPLYRRFNAGAPSDAGTLLKSLRTLSRRFDRFCPECGKDTTWIVIVKDEDKRNSELERATSANIGSVGRSGFPKSLWLSSFESRMYCARDARHQFVMYLNVRSPRLQDVLEAEEGSAQQAAVELMKVGQFPSLSDIQIGTLKQYEEGMTGQQRREFVRAINTSAHGFNVAACVHYRRVFESVLFDARDELMKETGAAKWPEFDRMRTDERISALKAYLPQFMVEHPHLYGILSKGVHELTEEECGEAMPVLRQAIELMIEDRVDAKRRAKRRALASVMLAKTVDKHKDVQ